MSEEPEDRPRRARDGSSGRFPAEADGDLPWTAFSDHPGRRRERAEGAGPTASTDASRSPTAPQPGSGAGWDVDSPPTTMLNVGEITSRRARRLAEQAAAEAAAQLVSRGVDDPTRRGGEIGRPAAPPATARSEPAPAGDWREDTMPLPRVGRHAGGPSVTTPSARTSGSAAAVAAGASAQPMTRAQARAQGRLADPPTRPVPVSAPSVEASASPQTGSLSRVAPPRDLDAAPRHEARGIVSRLARRRGGLAVLTIALLAVASLTGVVLVKVLAGGPDQGTSAGNPVAPPQQTLLVELQVPGQGLIDAAVMGVSGGRLGSVLVPGSLLLEVPGVGRGPLSSASSQGSDAAAQALSDALDARIDGTWTLTTSGLSSLVDALGGIFVDVNTQVVSGTTVVAAGPGQRLAGVQAVAVAVAKGEGEAEEARLARFQQVLRGLLRALPEATADLAPLLQPRAGASSGTMPVDRLAGLLAQARAAVASGSEGSSVVPLKQVEVAGQVQYSLDEAAVRDVVASQLPGALRPAVGASTVRVRVQNGVGVPGLTDAARRRLVGAGLRLEASGNAPEFGHARTQVLVRSGDAADQALGRRVAAALGLPDAQVAVDELGSATVDVVVVLGQDFADDVAERGVTPAASATGG